MKENIFETKFRVKQIKKQDHSKVIKQFENAVKRVMIYIKK